MAFGLRAEGWRVFASCRKQADCDALVAQGFDSPCIDYADPDSICGGLSEVLEATGGTLDALVHNGAYSIPGAVEDLPTDALRAIFEANVFGWHDLTRRVVPVMRAQGRCGAGRIVMISSVLGLVPLPMRGAYVASKFALEGLTDTLRIEMRDTGIDIITVEPGPITSHYRWEGKIESATEWICTAKSTQRLFTAIETEIHAFHSYDEPQIVALPLVAGSAGYLPEPWTERFRRRARGYRPDRRRARG